MSKFKVDPNKIQLGDRVKDKLTGFTGIAAGKATFLTGCTQFGVVKELKEGDTSLSTEYFDRARLEIIEKQVHKRETVTEEKNPGGPNRDLPKK
jgi:hypothetical protein